MLTGTAQLGDAPCVSLLSSLLCASLKGFHHDANSKKYKKHLFQSINCLPVQAPLPKRAPILTRSHAPAIKQRERDIHTTKRTYHPKTETKTAKKKRKITHRAAVQTLPRRSINDATGRSGRFRSRRRACAWSWRDSLHFVHVGASTIQLVRLSMYLFHVSQFDAI